MVRILTLTAFILLQVCVEGSLVLGTSLSGKRFGYFEYKCKITSKMEFPEYIMYFVTVS